MAPTVEIAFGHGTFDELADDDWTDVSDYLASDAGGTPVSCSSGRSSSPGRGIEVGKATVVFDNLDGRFDPRNADGPYFGDLKNGVPLRITTGGPVRFLSQGTASPNGVTIAGATSHHGSTVDVRATFRREDWNDTWDASARRLIIQRGAVWSVTWWKTGSSATPQILVIYTKSDDSTYTARFDIDDLGITDDTWCSLRVVISSAGVRCFGPAGEADPESTDGTPGSIKTNTTADMQLLSAGLSGTGLGGDLSDASVRIGDALVADLKLTAMESTTDTVWTNTTGDTVTRASDSSPAASDTGEAPIRFRGWVNSGWPQQFTERLPEVKITAHDLFGLLAQSDGPATAFAAEVAAHGIDPAHWWVPGVDGWIDTVTGATARHTGQLASTDPTLEGADESFGQDEPDGWGIAEHPDTWLSAADESLVIACRFRLAPAATRAATTDPLGELAYPVALLRQSEAVDSPPVGITLWPDYLQVDVNDDVAQRFVETDTTVALMDGREHSILVHVPAATGDIEVWLDGVALRTETAETAYATTIVPGPLYLGAFGPTPFLQYPHQGAIDPVIIWRDHPGTGLGELAADLHAAATTGWAGQRLDERLRSIVEGMGAETMIGDLDVSGVVTLQSYRQRSVIELFQTIEDTEQGRVWVDRSGMLRFSQRGWAWTDTEATAVQAVFSDDGDEIDGGAIEFGSGTVLNDSPLDLVNIARVTSENGRQQTAKDQTSIDTHGPRPVQLSNLLHPSDRQSLAIAEWIIYSQSDAPVRVEKITFAVESDPAVTEPVAQAIEEGWLTRLIKAAPVDTAGAPIGDPIDVQAHVIGVQESWPFGLWLVTLTVLSTRAGREWFRADDSTTDGPDVAAF